MRLSVLALALALVVAPISLASASSSFQQLSRQLHFKPLATNDQIPAGLPQLDPSTLKFIQFPNGINVNLQGYGTASLPQGYPLSSIPSYDASTNTITDPSISYAFAYALSEAANPSYDPNNPDGFLGGSLGGFIPGLTGIYDDGASGIDDNGGSNSGSDDSTGWEDGTLDGPIFATGLVIPGTSTGTSSLGGKSSTGVAVITNPRISSTGVASNSGTSPSTGGSVQGSSNTPISNPNNPKNGAAMVASSLAMVTGLVAAVLVATVL